MKRAGVALFVVMALVAARCGPRAAIAAPKLGLDGKIDAEFLKLHESFLERGKSGKIGLLFLGDSITSGWFWDGHKEIWDRHFGQYDPANFGISGDRTEHVLWRIEQGELNGIRPRFVVLLIGTNNIGDPAGDIRSGVTRIATEIHRHLPGTKLLLLGIFPRGAASSDPMRSKIKVVNAALSRLDDGKRTRFLDIGERFLAPDGTLPKEIMPDALHLNANGYRIWAEAMKPLLDEMMKAQ